MVEAAGAKRNQRQLGLSRKQILVDGLKVAFQWDLSLDGARQPQGAVSDEGGDNLINN